MRPTDGLDGGTKRKIPCTYQIPDGGLGSSLTELLTSCSTVNVNNAP